MSVDWAENVRKYVPIPDDEAIRGIIRHCGIALTKRDASLVAFSDKTETDRVRANFLKKKLGLTDSDAALDAQIAAVGERMKGEHNKNRVTVYYLLAEHYGKLPLFYRKSVTGGAASAASKVTAAATGVTGAAVGAGAAALGAAGAIAAGAGELAGKAGSAVTGAVGSVAAGAGDLAGKAGSAVTGAAGAVGGAALGAAGAVAAGAGDLAGKAGSAVTGAAGAVGGAALGAAGAAAAGVGAIGTAASGAVSGIASHVHAPELPGKPGGRSWLWLLVAVIAALAIVWFLHSCQHQSAAPDASATASATATPDASASATVAAAPAIPSGAGVTTETVDGKPKVNVYFATGKADIAPAFVPAAAGLKAYLDGHSGSSLAVSGYADPTGDAAFNAKLAKQRAAAVKAGLVSAGIADTAVAMVKPEANTANTDNAGARRVEVRVQP